MRIYLPREPMQPGEPPSLLAIGDSWFWYPKNNVLQALAEHRRLKDPYRTIQCLGYNGAKLEEYVFGKYAKSLEWELRPQNRGYYSAVLVSGAGNDAVDYRLGLFKNCSQAQAPDQCVNNDAMLALMGKLGTALGALIYNVRHAFARSSLQPSIILHDYDYPVPDGRGFDLLSLKVTGPWLAKAMDDCKVPPDMELRKGVCRVLIDSLHEEFSRFANPDQRIYLVDSRGALISSDYKDDWDNELHPTRKGFARVVDQRWIPLFQQLGYAT